MSSGVPADARASSDRPLHILHVINGLGLGGAEALLYRLVTRKSVHSHEVVSIGAAEWHSSRLEAAGIKVHHLNMDSPAAAPRGLLSLNRIVRESKADVVQCWMYRSNLLGGLVAKAAGKPVVWGIHCSSLEPLRLGSRAVAHAGGITARWIPDFVINCSAASEELHRALGFGAAAGGVVHNGYDPSVFRPDDGRRVATRQALGMETDAFVIGSISRWDPLKDIPNLLATLGLLRKRGLPFRCLLVGAGLDSRNAAFLHAMREAGCEDVVTALGSRSDIPDISRAMDLHVLASRTEAFPSAVGETMLCGTPNVVTEVGDAPLMVGTTGWVAPPRDPAGLAALICEAHQQWKERPAEWQSRRHAARARIAENFSFDRMARAYEDVWLKVAGRLANSP